MIFPTQLKEIYGGIIPAFYACYDKAGNISTESVRALAGYFKSKGVKGLYVGGSSGECIYQSVAERKLVLENVMCEAGDELTIIAHVACNNTADSMELARHAESLGVHAIAAIPPIYFKLPEYSIARYWNDISSAAPDTGFIIYNIPQLAGVALTPALMEKMSENPRVIGVKNSSMAAYDITAFIRKGAIVFNGPDEQLVSGLCAGAIGGIGGTYGAMPELYIRIYELVSQGRISEASEIQTMCCSIIESLCSGHCNMYAMIKEVLRINGAPDCGDVRSPLTGICDSDRIIAQKCSEDINDAIQKFCK